jgi:hypothetical protein
MLRPMDVDGVGVFCIIVGEDRTYYTVRELPCQIGGRGFAVHRTGLGELYHVRIGGAEDCSCECKGFLYHHHCKHVTGLLALEREGKV